MSTGIISAAADGSSSLLSGTKSQSENESESDHGVLTFFIHSHFDSHSDSYVLTFLFAFSLFLILESNINSQ